MSTFNPTSFVKQFAGGPGEKHLMEAAEEVAAEASKIAERPIMPRRGAPHFTATVWRNGEVQAVNTDYGAHWDEWGNVHLPARGTMRRAVANAGYKLDESS